MKKPAVSFIPLQMNANVGTVQHALVKLFQINLFLQRCKFNMFSCPAHEYMTTALTFCLFDDIQSSMLKTNNARSRYFHEFSKLDLKQGNDESMLNNTPNKKTNSLVFCNTKEN